MPHEELELQPTLSAEGWEENVWECGNCGTRFFDDVTANEVDGDNWCDECFDTDAVMCQKCEGHTQADTTSEVDRGEYSDTETWCESCVDSHAVTCERCETLTDGENYTTVGDRPWCEDCANNHAFYCEGCEEYNEMDEGVRTNDDNYICQYCYENYYFTCEGCGEVFNNEDAAEDTDDGYYCENCCEDHCPPSIGPHDATQKMSLIFHRLLPVQACSHSRCMKGLFFGVETELEVSEQARYDIGEIAQELLNSDANDFFYTMSDSTINHGFEVATNPFTWEWAMNNKDWWEPLFNLRRWCTAYDEPQCGMHVHLQRQGFKSKTHLLKFSRMFFEYPPFIQRISRRSEAKLTANGTTEWKGDMSLVYRAEGNVGGARGALAFNEHDTVECRIFQSTLNPRGYWANLEFLKALFDYTAEASMLDVSPEKFIGWVRSEGEYNTFLDVFDRRLPSRSER